MKKSKTYWTFTTEHSEPEIGTWKIKGKWHMARGTPEVFEVTICSASAESPVTTTALRSIPLTAIFDSQRATMKAHQVDQILVAVETLKGRRKLPQATTGEPGGSRQGKALDANLLKQTAHEYEIARISGLPVQSHIADVFGVSKSTAAKRIMAARAAGFINETNLVKVAKVRATAPKKTGARRKQ
jgi:hypothetical protein